MGIVHHGIKILDANFEPRSSYHDWRKKTTTPVFQDLFTLLRQWFALFHAFQTYDHAIYAS
jgi:hypothetical protein